MNDMQKHFDVDDNQYLRLKETQPVMNTLPFSKVLVDSRYFTGKYRVDTLQGDLMNIAFYENEVPDLYKGEYTDWVFHDDVQKVYVIDSYKLFVKGINVHLFLVQIQV